MTLNESTDDVVLAACVPLARPISTAVPVTPGVVEPMCLFDLSRLQAGWDILVLLIIAVAIEMVIGSVARSRASGVGDSDPRVLTMILTLANGAVLLVVIGGILRGRRQNMASIGLCVKTWWQPILLGVAAAVAAFAALFASAGVIYVLYPAGFAAMQENSQRITQELPKLHPVVLCLVAMFVGLYEEVIFRGFILTRLRRATGSAAVAVVLSSALFAAPHMMTQVAVVVIPISMLGIIFGVLTLWRRSVLAAIIGHALFDGIQFIWMYHSFPNWN